MAKTGALEERWQQIKDGVKGTELEVVVDKALAVAVAGDAFNKAVADFQLTVEEVKEQRGETWDLTLSINGDRNQVTEFRVSGYKQDITPLTHFGS